jgi:hypothetical protein
MAFCVVVFSHPFLFEHSPRRILTYRGYVVSPFGQDGFALLRADKIFESLKVKPSGGGGGGGGRGAAR